MVFSDGFEPILARMAIGQRQGRRLPDCLVTGIDDQVNASARVAARVAAIAPNAPCQANRQAETAIPARRHRSRHRIVASDAQMVTNGPALTPINSAISRCGSLSVTDSSAR